MKSSRLIRNMAALLAVLILVLSLAPGALAADGLNAAYYKLVDVQRGSVAGEVKVNIRERPNADSDRLGRLSPGESIIVTGESGDWWQVEFEGETGYILKELLVVTQSQEEVAVIVEDPLEATITGLTPPTLLPFRNEYRVDGVIASNIPLTGVTVEIYNERTLSVDKSISETMKRDDNIMEVDLDDIAGDLSFRKLDPGEKKLIIRAQSANDNVIVSETSFYVYTDGEPFTEALSMTGDCDLDASRGDEDDLTDASYTSGIEFASAEDSLVVALPEGRTAEGLALNWRTAPANITVVQLGADGAEISSETMNNDSGMIHFYYDVDPSARSIRISTSDADKMLSEVRVYEQDRVSGVVQKWQEIPDKVDLLVVSAHQDDEMLFFGGTIPYYAAQGKTVAVVYMANCSRNRYSEALDGLWSCGLTYHPVFLGLEDARLDSYDASVELWGMENTENALVELIRRYQPEVIVTHDVNGEYGHNQHKVTCAAVQSAVTKAGDPAIDPDSAESYGTWTPKKLYIHLYENNQITMEVYDEPVAELDGMTMTQIATIGYSKHVSQQDYFSMEKHGVRYDNRKYGLAFTTVGEDIEKNDFFENID